MLIGAHVKSRGPLETAALTGAGCVQMFLSDPQSWKKPEPRPDAALIRESPLPVYVHAPYLVNLASPNPKIRIPSRKILSQCCEAAVDVGAAAVIVHGGHVGAGDEIDEGIERWVKGLSQL
ncbi:MAG: TIM barrel protein, partial [Acidimicrobiales bacterium]